MNIGPEPTGELVNAMHVLRRNRNYFEYVWQSHMEYVKCLCIDQCFLEGQRPKRSTSFLSWIIYL